MLLILLGFLIIFYCIFGGFNYFKWRINDSWWIPILFGWFLELPKCAPNLAPYTLYLSPKMLQEYKKNYGNIFTKYYCSYLNIWEIQKSRFVEPTRHQTCGTNFLFICSKSGGSRTIGFSERLQKTTRWWNLDKFWKSENHKHLKT